MHHSGLRYSAEASHPCALPCHCSAPHRRALPSRYDSVLCHSTLNQRHAAPCATSPSPLQRFVGPLVPPKEGHRLLSQRASEPQTPKPATHLSRECSPAPSPQTVAPFLHPAPLTLPRQASFATPRIYWAWHRPPTLPTSAMLRIATSYGWPSSVVPTPMRAAWRGPLRD